MTQPHGNTLGALTTVNILSTTTTLMRYCNRRSMNDARGFYIVYNLPLGFNRETSFGKTCSGFLLPTLTAAP